MTITREQIARLRGIGCAYVLSEQVEALLDAAEAHLSEQSRIDAAVAKERERCIAAVRAKADEFEREWRDGLKADSYLQGKADGADDAADAIHGLSPTPTTEEGA